VSEGFSLSVSFLSGTRIGSNAASFHRRVPDLEVEACDCQGQCSSGPTVRVLPEETWYCRVRASDVPNIVERHLCGGEPVVEKLNPRIHMRIH
jgi:(2Fe-2S) ferredoxin